MTTLKEPFPLGAHEFKPTALTGDKSRALGIAYVDCRWYQHRLDEADVEWQDDLEVEEGDDHVVVTCHLTVDGVTRTDVGECSLNDKNAVTSATAQAFKRACSKFGLGRYLYFMPDTWADYDNSRKQFSDRGLRKLRSALKKALERVNEE